MNAPFRHPVAQAPARHRFTISDIYRLQEIGFIGEDSKFELLDGEIIDMPADGGAHLTFTAALNKWLAPQLGEAFDMMVQGTLHLSDDDVPEPDFYIYDAGARLEPIDMDALHLVIEVAVSSLGYDLSRKSAKYAEHGIPEYWVVDVNSRVTHVLRRLEQGQYRDVLRVPFEMELRAERLPFRPLTIASLQGLG